MKRFHRYVGMAVKLVLVLAIGFALGRATVFFPQPSDTTLAQSRIDQPSMRVVDSGDGARSHAPVNGKNAFAFDFVVPVQGEIGDEAQVFSFFMGLSR